MKRHPVGRIPEEENSYMMNVCIAPKSGKTRRAA